MTFGMIRSGLESLGTPIGAYDLQIAAIALTNNLTLITHIAFLSSMRYRKK